MPVFAFRKEGFDPHTAFAVRLLVGLRGVVRSHPIQIVLMHTATECPSLLTRRALCLERAVIAVLGAGPIAQRTLGGMRSIQMEFFACWTDVDIALSLIAELV